MKIQSIVFGNAWWKLLGSNLMSKRLCIVIIHRGTRNHLELSKNEMSCLLWL